MTKFPPLIKRKIISRLVFGYLLALSFTVAIVFLAFNGLNSINETVNDITIRLTATRTLTQDIDNKLQLVRYYAERYQRMYRQEDLDLFNQKMQELQDSQKQLATLTTKQSTLAMVDHIQKETVKYVAGFEQMTRLIMYQQMLLSTTFLKQELLVENQLSAIRINVANAQLPDIYFSFGNARRSFELMRLNQSKYMSEHDEKYFVIFKNNYVLAMDAFSDLIDALRASSGGEEVAQNAMKAQNELKLYYQSFIDIHTASISLTKLSTKLQQNDHQVTQTASLIALVVEEEYKASNHLTQKLVVHTQMQLLASVIIAVLINLGLIWVVLRKIITPIFHELQQLSNLDGLTKIANRRAFDIGIEKELKRCKREGLSLAIILSDVDFFKRYNDIYGHQQGDECLKIIATTMTKLCNRPGDLVARYGGEEFVIILPNTDAQGATDIANMVISSIEALTIPHERSSVSQFVTISMGVAVMTGDKDCTSKMLIHHADQALYKAKHNGRNCVVLNHCEQVTSS